MGILVVSRWKSSLTDRGQPQLPAGFSVKRDDSLRLTSIICCTQHNRVAGDHWRGMPPSRDIGFPHDVLRFAPLRRHTLPCCCDVGMIWSTPLSPVVALCYGRYKDHADKELEKTLRNESTPRLTLREEDCTYVRGRPSAQEIHAVNDKCRSHEDNVKG